MHHIVTEMGTHDGRRDSLRISGIPEVEESDDTDAAIITLCAAIKVDPPVQPEDIAVSHRVGKAAEGKPRPVLVKFATRNIRERVFWAKKKHQNWTREKWIAEKYIHKRGPHSTQGQPGPKGSFLQKWRSYSRHLDNLWKGHGQGPPWPH